MEDKQFQVDKMLDTLIDLASDEVNKAKQRGYFGKDFVEAAGIVISLANEKKGTGGYGTYGNRRNDYPGYGGYGNYGRGNSGYGRGNTGYGNDGGYGHYDEEEGYGESTSPSRRGRNNEGYGRNGERYG